MDTLYAQHLNSLQQQAEAALEHCGYDYLIIGSGHSELRFLDDYHHPFKPNPHFTQWVPLSDQAHCWLLVRPHKKPKLFYYQPKDFWHLVEPLPDAEWTQLIEVKVFDQPRQLSASLGRLKGEGALIAPPKEGAPAWGCDLNPSKLLNYLHFKRAIKTEWEQQNLRKANHIAVRGHNAAYWAFHAGASEFQIHQAYLNATQQCEKDLPYGNIVALNEHAAILHYQYQNVVVPPYVSSLLIDAGATYQGYAADITRTFTHAGTLFADLVRAMDLAQQELISTVRSGVDFVELHQAMQHKIASILAYFKIVHLDADAQLETNLIGTFFPHGLGHLLGLQVHDVGGHQQNIKGDIKLPPDVSPALRLTRTLENGMVVTIEPGLYFIPSLLKELSKSPHCEYLNWELIEQLSPYGGIRIEDNVLVHDLGCENLTRDAFIAAEVAA